MSISNLVDENFAVKIQRKAELQRPAEFKWLSSFESMNKKEKEEAEEKIAGVFCDSLFEYEKADAEQNYYDEEENKRQVDRVLVIRATDKETRVRIEYELEKRPEVHCLLIENENQEKPAGAFKVKKTMLRWKEKHLENNNKKFAWGRSLASVAHPVKKNRFKDWRKEKANIADCYGEKSKWLSRLDGFYMRLGIWWPIYSDDWQTEGLKIIMPTKNFLAETKKELGEDWIKEHSKYSKYEINKTKRNK